MLANELLQAFFGSGDAPAACYIGLVHRGTELKAGGYKRQRVGRGTWRVADGAAMAQVEFGPFTEPVTFDEARLYRDRLLLGVMPFSGEVSLPALVAFTHDAVIGIDG